MASEGNRLKRNRLSIEEFKSRSCELHNNKYSYEKTFLMTSNDNVVVTCPIHGDFTVAARRHFSKIIKQGCPDCTKYVKNNKDSFVERSRKIHGDKYYYDKVNYIGSGQKVTITCPIHGDFQVTPSLHYGPRSVGCAKCSNKAKLTTQDFIARSVEIYGNKYIYDKTIYSGSSKKLIITCPEHGDFELRASEHIGKPQVACKNCHVRTKRTEKMNTEEFIISAKAQHGNKYDYSESIYVSAKDNITIKCPTHGCFSIRPSAHYGKQRQGCPACGGRAELDSLSFIESSISKFGNRFSYEKTKYTNAITKVFITCIEHGDFEVKPNNHLHGNGGCRRCSGRPDLNNDDFIEKLKIIYGESIDYSKVFYQGQKEPITLVCRTHGEFKATPGVMLRRSGCPQCNAYNVDDFIKKANIVHGYKYDYSRVNYTSGRNPIEIVCDKHGVFIQKPSVHLSNRGCQICGIEQNMLSNRDPNEHCILYFLSLEYKGHEFWKIGITTKSIDIRFKDLSKDNVSIKKSTYVETTLQRAILAEAKVISENEDFLGYRGHILKHAKGGTECFEVDILELRGKSLEAYIS